MRSFCVSRRDSQGPAATPYGMLGTVMSFETPIAANESTNDWDTLTEEVAESVRVLRDGGVVVLPTDTLYGLAADIFDITALDKVFAIKERPDGLALPVLIDNWDRLAMIADSVPASAEVLAERFWPGSLTMVLKKKDCVSSRLTAGADTVAVRVPGPPGGTGHSPQVGLADNRHERQRQRGGRPPEPGRSETAIGRPCRLHCWFRSASRRKSIHRGGPDHWRPKTHSGRSDSLR